jgi:transcriptional regulator with XRE-family HTH domain
MAFCGGRADNLPVERGFNPGAAVGRRRGHRRNEASGRARGSCWGSQSVKMSAREIDAYVGQQMRKRREALGISQGRLGRHLGLTFSQIQKYEKGTNRIGAGRLYQIAAYLGVAPSHFFTGMESGELVAAPQRQDARREELRTLNDAFAAIRDEETRASVLALVRSLAGDAVGRHGRG